MTPHIPSTEQTALQAMETARNQEADGLWAGVALMRLVRRNVKDAVADGAVREAARLVAQTGESPEELFGEPISWAEQRVADWRAEGREAFSSARFTLRDVVVWSPAVAAMFSLIMVVSDLVFGRWTLAWTPALVLMPLLLAALVMVGNVVAQRANAARGFGWAVAATALATVPLILLLVLFFTGIHWTGPEGTFLWGLAQAAGYGLLAWLLARVWRAPEDDGRAVRTGAVGGAGAAGTEPQPGAGQEPGTAEQSDEAWLEEARGALRARGSLREREIRRHLAEAQAHARETGTGLREEYGPAGGYAWSLPGDRTLGLRREILLRGLPLVFVLVLAISTAWSRGWSWSDGAWSSVIWFLLSAWIVADLVRRPRTLGAQRGRGGDGGA